MDDAKAVRWEKRVWYEIGLFRLALDRPEEALAAFRKGLSDKDWSNRDWSPVVDACSRSSESKDHAYGVQFALWTLSHSRSVKTMAPFAAVCAEKQGESKLAAWFLAVGRGVQSFVAPSEAMPAE
ncbi:hypothetical protein BH11ARM2_BH11ARM2_22190 [soil metagenome]